LLTFLLAKQKKSELPPGNPRPAGLRRVNVPPGSQPSAKAQFESTIPGFTKQIDLGREAINLIAKIKPSIKLC
jgi:hypothetical protein